MSEIINFTTPVGRLVQGSVTKPQTKDADGNPLVVKNGPNTGQPRVDYHIAIAIPKTDPEFNTLVYAHMVQAARTGHPTQFDASGQCVNPQFSWKYQDGDSQIPNTKGRKPCDREGFPGNWVLHFSGGYAPTCFEIQNGQRVEMTDLSKIKTGCFIQVNGSVKPNNSQQRPGIYLNHSLVQFVAYGEEIRQGPDANEVFGDVNAAALPAGASLTPLAPTVNLAHPATPGAPVAAPAMAAPALPAAQPAAPVAPAVPAGAVTPAPEFLNPAAPAAQPATPAAPAAPAALPAAPAAPVAEKSYNVSGQVFTHSQLVASGWNETQIAALPTA